MDRAAYINLLKPLLEFAATLDLGKALDAKQKLESKFPFQGDYIRGLGKTLQESIAKKELCDKGDGKVFFSRISKAVEETSAFSIDVVTMTGPGPDHVHPNGEIDLCFAVEGNPTFDGHAEGWVVFAPVSRHIPTVNNGKMTILYLLPQGAFQLMDKGY